MAAVSSAGIKRVTPSEIIADAIRAYEGPRVDDLAQGLDAGLVDTLRAFGDAAIIGFEPASPPGTVVDLGTNPTREQVRAAGFDSDSATYREALRAFERIKRNGPAPVSIPCRADDEVDAFVGCLGIASISGGLADALCTWVVGVEDAYVRTVRPVEIEVFVDGGDPDEICEWLYRNTPAGILCLGTESGCVEHAEVRFSRGAAKARADDSLLT